VAIDCFGVRQDSSMEYQENTHEQRHSNQRPYATCNNVLASANNYVSERRELLNCMKEVGQPRTKTTPTSGNPACFVDLRCKSHHIPRTGR